LKNLLDTVAQERNDIEMHCFVSDLYDGLSLAKKLEYQNYDIILSRAGTAKLISEESILPVIDIKLSILDMVRAIELAQGYTRKFAIMGYNTITDIAKDVCEIFKYDTIIKTIHNASDIESILLELKNQGINLIVGDVVTTTHSKRFGFNTILITTGKESVINAIDEAVQLNSLIRKIKNRNSIIEKIFENINQLIVCLNEENHIIYCNEKKFLRDYSKLTRCASSTYGR
jgi:transcriptional regulator with PAS, ATPase and Fis domain